MDGLISYFPESDVAVVRQLAGGGGCRHSHLLPPTRIPMGCGVVITIIGYILRASSYQPG